MGLSQARATGAETVLCTFDVQFVYSLFTFVFTLLFPWLDQVGIKLEKNEHSQFYYILYTFCILCVYWYSLCTFCTHCVKFVYILSTVCTIVYRVGPGWSQSRATGACTVKLSFKHFCVPMQFVYILYKLCVQFVYILCTVSVDICRVGPGWSQAGATGAETPDLAAGQLAETRHIHTSSYR
jgi:hypothetical protein